MSKLLDKLQRSSHTPTQPLGFRAKVTASKNQSIPLIAALPQTNLGLASDVIAAGSDALLIQVEQLNQAKNTLAALSKTAGDIPWGVSLKNIKRKQIDQLLKMGCDFMVFEAATAPASLLEEERVGKIVMIDPSLSDGLIETVEQLPVDAVFINEREQGKSTPSIYHLMLCQYLSNLTDKPLLFEIDSIDVSNFNGRSGSGPHIVLYAKDNTKIMWGAELGAWSRYLESTDEEKLNKLYSHYKEYGSLLNNVKYINLCEPRGNIPRPVDKY